MRTTTLFFDVLLALVIIGTNPAYAKNFIAKIIGSAFHYNPYRQARKLAVYTKGLYNHHAQRMANLAKPFACVRVNGNYSIGKKNQFIKAHNNHLIYHHRYDCVLLFGQGQTLQRNSRGTDASRIAYFSGPDYVCTQNDSLITCG